MAKSLNRVQLIGNLTRDPELKYTPAGTAVCNFSIATNRTRKTDTGETKDEADFHRIVAWDKLADICAKYLKKGRKTYVEGRLQTRKWEGQDGQAHYMTEVIINDMILLDRAGEVSSEGSSPDVDIPDDFDVSPTEAKIQEQSVGEKSDEKASVDADEDIPF